MRRQRLLLLVVPFACLVAWSASRLDLARAADEPGRPDRAPDGEAGSREDPGSKKWTTAVTPKPLSRTSRRGSTGWSSTSSPAAAGARARSRRRCAGTAKGPIPPGHARRRRHVHRRAGPDPLGEHAARGAVQGRDRQGRRLRPFPGRGVRRRVAVRHPRAGDAGPAEARAEHRHVPGLDAPGRGQGPHARRGGREGRGPRPAQGARQDRAAPEAGRVVRGSGLGADPGPGDVRQGDQSRPPGRGRASPTRPWPGPRPARSWPSGATSAADGVGAGLRELRRRSAVRA